jgi:ParB/RepB/Spo0J family partition protein
LAEMPQEKEKTKVSFKGIHPSLINLDENIRKSLNTESEDFLKLVESIKVHGIIQAVLIEEREKENYICVEGHRRILAAIRCGKDIIPCMVKKYNNLSSRTEEALAADSKQFLNALDRADAYLSILNSGKEIEEIAKMYERDPLTVHRYIKMAKWPSEAKELIYANQELFSAKFLLHNYVQKSVDGEELINAIKTKIESKLKPKKDTQKNMEKLEIAHSTKLISHALEKYSAKVNLKEKDSIITATFKFDKDQFKDFIDNLQKT